MAKWRKTTVAGPLVMEAVYPAINPRDSETVRREKKKLTTMARQLANDNAAYRKLELWLAANFTPGDLFLTLTYDDAHLPGSRKEALSRIRYFWRKLSAVRAAKGQELRYIYVTEQKHGEGRWHHHVFINATGEDFEDIRKAWIYGKVQEWEAGVSYAVGNIRRYDGQLYRCVQAHTSQADWTPDTAVSLWVRIADPADEWPEWSQPVGAHDAYQTGDKVSHGGQHWVSTVDGNVWEPGVYGWEKAE